MSKRRPPDPSLLVVACFSRHCEAVEWAQQRLLDAYGPLERVSDDYDFHHTKYYAKTMGPGLKKRLLVLAPLRPSDILVQVKHFTIGLENDLARRGRYSEQRPLNLDPGLLQLGKFLLASTKDHSHRIYLGDGIYGEVTLRFEGKGFECLSWTFADYREPAIREFLAQARERLYQRILQLRGGKASVKS
jgi:hypothetical protein